MRATLSFEWHMKCLASKAFLHVMLEPVSPEFRQALYRLIDHSHGKLTQGSESLLNPLSHRPKVV